MKPPSEITRSPRSLTERQFWKASEWRAFLLFYSPVILRNELPSPYYEHWLLLVHAMHLLMAPALTLNDISKAELCLVKFVTMTQELYMGLNMCLTMCICWHTWQTVLGTGAHCGLVQHLYLRMPVVSYYNCSLVRRQCKCKYFVTILQSRSSRFIQMNVWSLLQKTPGYSWVGCCPKKNWPKKCTKLVQVCTLLVLQNCNSFLLQRDLPWRNIRIVFSFVLLCPTTPESSLGVKCTQHLFTAGTWIVITRLCLVVKWKLGKNSIFGTGGKCLSLCW